MFALAACSSSSDSSTTAGSDATAGGEVRASATIAARTPARPTDLSPVAEPAGTVATFRVGPLDETLTSFGRLIGDPDATAEKLAEVGPNETGSPELGALVDTSAGTEMMLVAIDGEMQPVMALQGPSMARVAAALPMSWRLEARADGSLLVPGGDGDDETLDERGRVCSVEPTMDPEHTRIVCAEHEAELDAARHYLARNFAEAAPANTLRLSLAIDAIRATYGETVHGGITMASAAIEAVMSESEVAVFRNAQVIAAVTRLARDVLDDVSSLVDEANELDLTFTIMGDQLDVDANFGVVNPSGSIVRAFGQTLRNDTAVSEDLIAHLPPGAVVYGAGHWDGSAFADLSTEARDVVSALVRAGVQLSQADIDALDRGLAYAFQTTAYDFGVASGFDGQAQQWAVVSARYPSASDATHAVDAIRQMVAVFRRPTVARAIDALFADLGEDRPRFAQIAEVRTNGLPRGSYAVRMPPFELLATRFLTQRLGTAAANTGVTPVMRETLVVPSGADVTVVQAPNATQVYRGLASAGGIAADIRSALLQPGASMNLVMRLGNVRVPNQPADDDAGLPTFESVIGVEAGQALTFIRVRNAGEGSNLRFELDTRIEGVLIRGLAQAGASANAAQTQPLATPAP